MALLTTVLVCLAASSGCAAPPPAESFAISYERNGGFAPMPRKLTIQPGRRGTVVEQRRGYGEADGAATIFRVRTKTIEGLRRALAEARFRSIPSSPGPSGCADCYRYEIRYRGHEVEFDESETPRGLRGVLARLDAIVEAHRPFH
jgi:hypothetical protein